MKIPAAPATPAAPPTAAGWSVGESGGNRLEELRERLQAKIAASRMARKAEESKEKAAKAREWREEKKMTKAEKKRKERAEAAVGAAMDGKKSGKRRAEEDADATEDEDDLQFGRVEVDGKVGGPPRKKRADKQTLLRKALDQRKEIADAGGEETEAGKKVAERYSWDAALARAGGEKVLDDPKLLQKSVKNEARMKKRSAQKWEAGSLAPRNRWRRSRRNARTASRAAPTPRWRSASKSERRSATDRGSRAGRRVPSTSDFFHSTRDDSRRRRRRRKVGPDRPPPRDSPRVTRLDHRRLGPMKNHAQSPSKRLRQLSAYRQPPSHPVVIMTTVHASAMTRFGSRNQIQSEYTENPT